MLRRVYKQSPRLRRSAHRGKDALLFHAARAAVRLIERLPPAAALAGADRVGNLAYALLGTTRRLALEHLEIVLGNETSAAERARIARASVRNVARCFCEVAMLDAIRADFDRYVEIVGWENVAAGRERGAVVVSAHLGNWELLAAFFAARLDAPVAAVARRLDEPRLNQFLIDVRARGGVETILRESSAAPRQILGVFKRRGLLAVLIDQDTKAPSVTVPFLGRPARTPYAPAALALRRNLPLVVAYSVRLADGRLRFVVTPPVEHPSCGDAATDTRQLTARLNEILSAAIRASPESWVWWHRRWRHRPMQGLDMDSALLYGGNISSRSPEVRK